MTVKIKKIEYLVAPKDLLNDAVDVLSEFVKRAELAGWRLCRSLYHCRMVLYGRQQRFTEMQHVLGEMSVVVTVNERMSGTATLSSPTWVGPPMGESTTESLASGIPRESKAVRMKVPESPLDPLIASRRTLSAAVVRASPT